MGPWPFPPPPSPVRDDEATGIVAGRPAGLTPLLPVQGLVRVAEPGTVGVTCTVEVETITPTLGVGRPSLVGRGVA